MTDTLTATADLGRPLHLEPEPVQSNGSAVSWSAVLAGAAAAAALSLLLLTLGTGLGMSSVSPWAEEGVSAKALGISTILWLTLTQLAAAGMGGYIAGRLRTRWIGVHTDEVYFRDTAHGFLAWGTWSLLSAMLLTATVGGIVSSGIQAGASVAGGLASTATAAATAAAAGEEGHGGPMSYHVDSLFRQDMNATPSAATGGADAFAETSGQENAATATEISRIFINAVRSGSLPREDVRYVGQVVAQRTGMTQQDAEKRVADTYAGMQARLQDAEVKAKSAADDVRKASAYAAIWLFVSMLLGAFVASFSATFGGRHRDL